MNYRGLSRVADDFQAKATGNNPAFEGVSDEPRDKYTASDRRVCEIGIKDFNTTFDGWIEFCNDITGEGGPTGAVAKVWLDEDFMETWGAFVEEVGLVNKIIQSKGSNEAYDAYAEFIDTIMYPMGHHNL